MSTSPEALLARLNEIAQTVSSSGRGLALLGLGSVGQDLARLDNYSDLDFFVIARARQKPYFRDSLAWLEEVQAISFSFMNTADGHKLLFADGIFCEMAVFEADELANIPYTGARVIWQDEGSDRVFAVHNNLPPAAGQSRPVEWLVGEILSNLYVGLGRYQRGEKLTAARFIQGHAVDRLLELAPHIAKAGPGQGDPFDLDRRFEQRYPQLAAALPQFLPGYDHSPRAARAILNFLERELPLNEAMKEAILALC